MEQQHDKNWWGRNWKWFVPVGCFGATILFIGFIFLIMLLISGMIKSSDAYKAAIAEAKIHPAVQEELGSPIEPGLFVSGTIKSSGPSGQANLSIPISGPDGKGTLYVVAYKSVSQWLFSALVVEIEETRQRIDLLE